MPRVWIEGEPVPVRRLLSALRCGHGGRAAACGVGETMIDRRLIQVLVLVSWQVFLYGDVRHHEAVTTRAQELRGT